MNLIAAVDKNWAIGYENKLLVSIPADMRFFREQTTNKIVIMGKKTLDTFPGGKPLKKRRNIVISRQADLKVPDCEVVHSIEAALEAVKDCEPSDVYVIGGAEIYRQMLDYCNVAYITKIDYGYHADTYFPNLDENPDWIVTEESEEQTYYDLEYRFCKYERKK
ncbi:MAG: dihydrofolate reductase [Lachnospiraceae bacterium]|nr:dihydrofolate reductase [Lachnospiraceae bacterium]